MRTMKIESTLIPVVTDKNYSIVLDNEMLRCVLAFVTMITMMLMGIFVTDLKFAFELMGAICANLVAWIIPAQLQLGISKEEKSAFKT